MTDVTPIPLRTIWKCPTSFEPDTVISALSSQESGAIRDSRLTGDKAGRLAHKRLFGRDGDDSIAFAPLDTASIVRCVAHILVDSKTLARDRTLVD